MTKEDGQQPKSSSSPPTATPQGAALAIKPVKPEILCVDDEPFILEGLVLNLRRDFSVTTSTSAQDALEILKSEQGAKITVIVSDMHMPGLDGATFLKRASRIRPNAVRMLLAGRADLDSTIQAVNSGQIFKYISKPCPAKKLLQFLTEAHEEFLRVEAEAEILKQTLRGSVQVLTELLGSINPSAFGCAVRVQRAIKQMTQGRFPNSWQFELAALLSQIGCVTLPLDTLNKVTAGQELTEEESDLFSSHPTVAEKFLRQIPRLEEIAKMVAQQQHPINFSDAELELDMQNRVKLGAQLLRVAVDFDHLVTGGYTTEQAILELSSHPTEYDQRIVEMLTHINLESTQKLPRYVHAQELSNGMIVDEDITTQDGVVLISAGAEVSYQSQTRLKRFAEHGRLNEPFRVLIRQ